ncbi:hypothetical protein IT402_00830 [Candidatus Nomurabacteria bacterium]|nr:hypothetical protein [Candidatus Nomurabacteria bacterium]
MDQMSKDINYKDPQRKSPWAIILIFIVVVLFGVFWLIEKQKESVVPSPVSIEQKPKTNFEKASDLEAAVGSIEIPSYSN